MKSKKAQKWIKRMCLFFTIVMAVSAIDEFKNEKALAQNGVPATAKIVGIKKVGRKSAGIPKVQFTDRSNLQVETTIENRSGRSYKVGQNIEIVYHPDNPQQAKAKEALSYAGSGMLAGMGILFFAIWLFLIVKMKPKA